MRLTPEDIRNVARKSGYDHVRYDPAGSSVRPYRAGWGARSGPGTSFHGPRRAVARDAAQDYCDYINGNPSAVRKPPASTRVTRDPLGDDHEVQAALGVLRDARAQRRKLAQGYVYLISDGTAVKVGYSTKPEARVNELQTGNPRELRLLAKKEGTEATEATLHARFLNDNIVLEWFRPTTGLLSWFGVHWDADKRLKKETE